MLAVGAADVTAQPLFTTQDIVPDEATAVKLAVIIFDTYFGKELTAKGQPYKATLRWGEWWVGTATISPDVRGGGMPELVLSPKDGRVVRIGAAK